EDQADPKARTARGATGQTALGFAEDWADLALVGGADHSHRDPKQHENRSTPNFETLGYNPLITDYYGRTAGDHACGDTKEKDGRRLSVTHSFGTDVAFVIADVTNPAEPKKIGELVMFNTQVYDLAISPDLRWVVLATSPMDAGPSPPEGEQKTYAPDAILFRDACTGEERIVKGPEAGLPYHSGNVLVDISNPRNPSVADFLMYPVLGAHSVTITDLKGRAIVLSSVPNAPSQASYYVFMEIRALPVGAKLVPLSVYQFGSGNTGPVVTSGSMHDGLLAKHPVTGKFVAYLAYGGTGLVMLDVEDPANPKFLSRWNNWGSVGAAAPTSPFIHEALPAADAWDGKHFTFIGEECVNHPAKTPTCLVFGLDTTDPTKPSFVGGWTLPVDVHWAKGLEYSLHYLALQNRTLFVTAYHGGVWAVDVSTDEARATMPSIGAFLPSKVSPKKFVTPPRGVIVRTLYGGYALDNTPTVLDLNVLSDGTLVVFDMQSGLYTVRFDAANPAPSPNPWPLK
ncbi:MAG TPA: hypothetical protein VI818_08435, partial [Candidatus Thermoplasmatota archaeon]|nr:hypothetical protein [Candidatus Thermoplasmatota archaeon]